MEASLLEYRVQAIWIWILEAPYKENKTVMVFILAEQLQNIFFTIIFGAALNSTPRVLVHTYIVSLVSNQIR